MWLRSRFPSGVMSTTAGVVFRFAAEKTLCAALVAAAPSAVNSTLALASTHWPFAQRCIEVSSSVYELVCALTCPSSLVTAVIRSHTRLCGPRSETFASALAPDCEKQSWTDNRQPAATNRISESVFMGVNDFGSRTRGTDKAWAVAEAALR